MNVFLLIWDTLYVLAFGGFLIGAAWILFWLVVKAYAEWLSPDDTDV